MGCETLTSIIWNPALISFVIPCFSLPTQRLLYSIHCFARFADYFAKSSLKNEAFTIKRFIFKLFCIRVTQRIHFPLTYSWFQTGTQPSHVFAFCVGQSWWQQVCHSRKHQRTLPTTWLRPRAKRTRRICEKVSTDNKDSEYGCHSVGFIIWKWYGHSFFLNFSSKCKFTPVTVTR